MYLLNSIYIYVKFSAKVYANFKYFLENFILASTSFSTFDHHPPNLVTTLNNYFIIPHSLYLFFTVSHSLLSQNTLITNHYARPLWPKHQPQLRLTCPSFTDSSSGQASPKLRRFFRFLSCIVP